MVQVTSASGMRSCLQSVACMAYVWVSSTSQCRLMSAVSWGYANTTGYTSGACSCTFEPGVRRGCAGRTVWRSVLM